MTATTSESNRTRPWMSMLGAVHLPPCRGSDFKLRCGTRWQPYLGLRFESPDKEQEENVLCPGIKPASGIQV